MEVTSTLSYCTFLPQRPGTALAIGYRVCFSLIHFIVFTLLLLQYCRIQGSPCITGGKSRKTSDQDQEQSAEEIELSSRVQHTGVELE
ncbi:immunoglobulin superfamily member 1-like [Acipenser oxyrinchus oxyrinchus]|nr:immunoglobulin superfamily member 1-like [Acipenser oxyrinchus oxyrinchus]KAK1153665.1 immunoglobulin superfamily member 1-like [Acipenser oxyrinchus oxyrinchus]KAK1153679.1 immunoglobulin superfamily member 1-like [Acipenser oxyrinchus oxyrinchus]